MTLWVPIISAAVLVVAICIIGVIIWKTRCRRQSNWQVKKRRLIETLNDDGCKHFKLQMLLKAKEVDNNPVYGLYYTSGGERIDEGVAEVVDENSDYYGR